ncbi:LysR family transcriptional regulator [Bradyrhizobium tropiciagri]|uniref:LysR family transcriptional regulator n=1 Tax=Bradyrhizobium tropiciagri TaxID=312253 RepID=UPI000B11ED70|nr:LysR family transcriptional regulator [Bradyrhizobium tropiciagri]
MAAELRTTWCASEDGGCQDVSPETCAGEAAPVLLPRVRMTEANWDLFRLFFAVASTGSVNRAARELGMSQPTLSRRLKELERYIGAPLFFRVSSGVKLTEEGEALRRSAEGMVRSFESFHRDLSLRVGDRSCAVKISATEGLTKHWLLRRVRKLHALNSHIRLEINSTVQQQNLAASDLDFVIRMGHPGDDELIGRRVATASFGIFASEVYLARHPAPQSFAELSEHEIIGCPTDFAALRGERTGELELLTRFKAAGDTRGWLRTMPIANHFAATVEGLGLAFLAVPFALAEGLVRVLPHESSTMDVWLLRRRETDLRKMTRQVRRFLEAEFNDSRAWFMGHQGLRTPLQRTA